MYKNKSQLLFRRLCLIVVDIISIILSFFLSAFIAYNGSMELSFLKYTYFFIPILLIGSLFFFIIMKLYDSLWSYASINELLNVIIASICSSILYCILCLLIPVHPPISTIFLYLLLLLVFIGGSRFGYRFVRLYASRHYLFGRSDDNESKVMIVGAGSAGEKILRETLVSTKLHKKVVCFIDDDATKHNRRIHNVPIVGGRNKILTQVEKYKIDEIYVALPSIDDKETSKILNICKETKCKIKKLPGMYQFLNDEITLEKLKDVEVQDLLGRDPVQVNLKEIMGYVKDKVVMVTGGGGSIGSELCRQIAASNPKQLIIVDIYENNAYDIEQELKASYPNLNLKVLIGSVRDSKRINWVFETYKPEIVYHAAAHKHVPLMENSPCEAIKNNVVGTYKTAYAAMMNGCQRFVLISTDKAVNPTNIMGASKRLCEMVVQSMNMVSHNGHTDWLPRLGGHRKDTLDALHDNEGQAYVSENPASKAGTGTEFVAVRFGNVLGSNGSVIPLFKRQIEKGGPVTVTHPDIIRYFMTIPEAVSLVLQAGTYAKGGEIFVLDMGAPVKIDTLARNLIKLSGYTPDVDIKVTYTGLRPGEKLYEEKLMAEEGMEKTPNDLIHIGKPIEMDVQEFFKQLEVLAAYGYANSEKIRDIVAAIVPTYHSADSDLKLHKKVYEELMSEAAVAAEKN